MKHSEYLSKIKNGTPATRPGTLGWMRSPLSSYRIDALWGLVVASQVLVNLYRSLRDSKQQDRAMRLGSYGIEQLQRANLYKVVDLRQRTEALRAGLMDEVEVERRAWRHGLQAGFEMGFLVAMGQGVSDSPGLQGALGQVQRTLGAGVLGLSTAFPVEEAVPLVQEALERAQGQARVSMRTQFEDSAEGLTPEEVDALLRDALPHIREVIWRAVLVVRPEWGSLPALEQPRS